MKEETPAQIFELWYEKPLQVLEAIADGSGATVALATALFLYERYFSALIRAKPPRTTEHSVADQLALDLPSDKAAAEIFWEMSRNGLLHQGMILQAARGKTYPGYSKQHRCCRNFSGKLPLAELLRLRVRYFTDGALLGSRDYVEALFEQKRTQFGQKRETGARPMRGLSDAALCVLRDLRVNVFG